MEGLSARQVKILEVIIRDYIETAEPIGSRTIAKKYDFGISSATIRNEMSDLEALGLIVQPHASAGRVPSDLGYRLFVDRMMTQRALSQEETLFLQRMIMDNIHQVENLMQETAKAIAGLTRYATIVSAPDRNQTVIKHVQLVPLDENSIVVIRVTESKAVKNKTVYVPNPPTPDYDTLTRLSKIVNTHLQNQIVETLDKGVVDKLLHDFGEHAALLMPVLGALVDKGNTTHVKVYTGGLNNFFAFPEFADRGKAQTVFQFLEENDVLPLLSDDAHPGLRIIIGTENPFEPLRACSIVRAGYSVGQQTGSIGIIGPTRMDYVQAVSVLQGILHNIETVLEALTGG